MKSSELNNLPFGFHTRARKAAGILLHCTILFDFLSIVSYDAAVLHCSIDRGLRQMRVKCSMVYNMGNDT